MAAVSSTLSFLILCFSVAVVLGQSCREGWHLHGLSCYGFGESPITWGDAQELCIDFKAKLVEIETADENNYVKNLVRNKQATVAWIGGTDIFDEGTWEWTSTGQEINSFLDWGPGEPSDSAGGEDCLTLYQPHNYQWNDLLCSNTATFVCEAEATDIIVG